MGRIFLSAGHFLSSASNSGDPGAVALGTTETEEVIKTRDLIEQIFNQQNIDFLSVPDHIDLRPTINWINRRSVSGDVAVELHCNAFNGNVRGTEAFFIAGNNQRKAETQLLLQALLNKVPELKNRGAKPDNAGQHSRLAFCRDVNIPSILIELCFIDNRDDLHLLQNHRNRFANGLAKGLIDWSNQTPSSITFPQIKIRLNDQNIQDLGILVNNNSYIPIDLVDQLELSISKLGNTNKITHGNIVYVKAIELNKFNISISWEASTKTVILDSTPRGILEDADHIMDVGRTTQSQFEFYLNKVNSEALRNFPDIAKLYIEEAEKEGVNHDIAFCQMCLETGHLQFGNQVNPNQNNFCGLGAVDGGGEGASFNDTRTGIKACIQHLKAYGSTAPISHPPIIDPRFDLVSRGVAETVHDLAGRWASDPEYGEKILRILKRVNEVF